MCLEVFILTVNVESGTGESWTPLRPCIAVGFKKALVVSGAVMV